MSPDPDRVQDIFLAAAAHEDSGARAAVLDRECSGDTDLRRRVEALLRAHDAPYSGLDRPFAVLPERRPSGPHDLHDVEAGDGPPSGPTIGLGAAASAGTAGRPPADIPGYEILGELGRGGMGVVYRARQVDLDRPCALKMILGGAHARPDALARFLAEARAIARLHHPDIVQVHHIGEADGLPFIELEFVDGGSLDGKLDGTPWPARKAAELVGRLARAVAEAHRLGIVHRDLKPGNVLLDADGAPKVTDFGLAKAMDTDSGLTATEAIMGSPSYMAPEQAQGHTKHLGPPADIYALGAILYELLTGRPPFKGATLLETLEQTKTLEPVPPSRLVPGTAHDMETIALKCLQKEPAKRYASAVDLADDLGRFLNCEPIVARPVGPIERTWRWCRRHPAAAAQTAAVVAVAALGLIGVLWQWNEAVEARDLASRRAISEADARRQAEAILVDMYTTSGIAAGDQGDPARAVLWFANAARRDQADPERRRANAIRAETWSRRAFRPLRAVVADGSFPEALVVHPGGRHAMTASVIEAGTREARLALWDLDAERPLTFPGGASLAPAAAWSPDGALLAVGGMEGDVILARFPGGEEVGRVRFPGRIHLLAFGPDGHSLAIAGGATARVWDLKARGFATPELPHPDTVTTLAFGPEGRSLAIGCRDGRARLFRVPGDSAEPLWPDVPHLFVAGNAYFREFGSPPAFARGGRDLITCEGKALVWRSAETGAEVRRLEFPEWARGLAAAVPGPDGRHLAVSGVQMPSKVVLVEADTGRRVDVEPGHKNTIMGLAFSPDGRTLATGSTDATVRLWRVPEGTPLGAPLGLHRTAHLVAFAPGERSLLAQDHDLVRLWMLPEEGLPTSRVPVEGPNAFAALGPDGALMVPTGLTFLGERGLRSTRAHRVASAEPAGPPLSVAGTIMDAAVSPDGGTVALGGDAGASASEVATLDWANGRLGWRKALPSGPRSVAYRPDGRRLGVLCAGGEAVVFDAASGRELRRWKAHDEESPHHWINNGKLAFSPDGASLLTWGMGKDLRVWDAESGRQRYAPIAHRDKCHDVAFSPDGRLLATASYDGSARVRDLATGAFVADLPEHPDLVYAARFSPDGRLLATACRDRMVRVWDWRAGRLACPPFEHGKETNVAVFTPDGRWVVSVSIDGSARAWDWRTGKPVTPPVTIDGAPLSIVVTSDGRHAVAGGFSNSLTVIDLANLVPARPDPEALCRRAELIAGQSFHEGGGAVNLSASEWLGRWEATRERPPLDR